MKDELKWAEEESKINTKEDLISYFMKRFKYSREEAEDHRTKILNKLKEDK